jgi:MATE family multidrug resistance protein
MPASGSSDPPSARSLAWAASPTRELVRLAWPITVSTLSFSAMNLTATAFVASIGSDELAGVGLAGVVAFALVCFGVGLLRGAKTLVSQAIGAGRPDRVDPYLGAAVGLALGFGALAMIAGQLLGPAVAALCASPRAGTFAAEYLALRTLAAPMVLVYSALREARYGEGDSKSPMRAALAGNAMNIGVDIVLILGLGWGVKGAALGTLAGNAVELAVLAWPMRKRIAKLRWRPDAARAVWAQGVPNGLQFTMEVGAFLILTAIVAQMSSTDAAAHQLVLNLINVSFLPAHAIAEAAAILVGQAVGANRDALVPRVARRAFVLGTSYAVAWTIGLVVLGGSLARAFAQGDTVLVETATTLIHISLVFLIADAANVIARGVLRGTGDAKYAAWVGILTSWLTTPPLAWLLGIQLGLGAAGGWIGLAGEIIVSAGLYWLRIVRGGWRGSAQASRETIVRAPHAAATEPIEQEHAAQA